MSPVWVAFWALAILVVGWLVVTISVGLLLNWHISREKRRDADELARRGRLNQALGDRRRP